MSKKVLVLGLDGLDPDLCCEHIKEGIMPNLKKLLEIGSARADLHMLGSHPTVTPPMWTTLATGAQPYTHGITDFFRQNPEKLDTFGYALDSTLCQAEPLWNVTAEAGMKTLVFHWPGSSWPPTSDNENLIVIDGTQPETVNMGTAQLEGEYLAICSNELSTTTFKQGVGQGDMMCVITDLEAKDPSDFNYNEFMHFMQTAPEITRVQIAAPEHGDDAYKIPYDLSLSPIKEPEGWALEVPEGALESIVLMSRGTIRRPILITKNDAGEYDTVVMYRTKKDVEPVAVLPKNTFIENVIDDCIKNDVKYTVNRNMKLIDIEPDGSKLRIWISAAMDINDDRVWSPTSLYQEIVENVGYPYPVSNAGDDDAKLIKCAQEAWWRIVKWHADVLDYMIEEKGVEVVFSHMHSVDAQDHRFYGSLNKYAKNALDREVYLDYLREINRQADYYIGRALHFIDEGWTVIVVSDHGLSVVPIELNSQTGCSINGDCMVEWGFTVLQKDENGNDLPAIDWSKTKAIMTRMNMVYINLEGRNPAGIVKPEDKWQLEEEIITRMYELKNPKTGMRVFELAVRNKDAYIFGLGGPECGDIVFFTADDYTGEHNGGLSTCIGDLHTTQSPMFAAAGVGIKKGFVTERVIHETDPAATVAWLLGVRMPADCEGAPIYQIFD